MSSLRQDADKKSIVNLTIFPANKGLLSSIPSTLIEHEFLSESRNLIHTTHGSRKTRPGLTPYYIEGFGSGGIIRGMFDFWRTTAGIKVQKEVVVTDGKIFSDSGDGLFTDVWSPNPAFDSDALVSMDALVGLLIIGVEGRAPIKYNQTGLAQDLGGTPPNGWIIRKHRSSIWIAGDADNPEKLYKSDTENPEEWTLGTADTFNIDLGASDPVGITALSPSLYGRMYIGKWNSIYELQTDAAGSFVNPISESIGMISHNAVVSTGNDIIFPSKRGIHSLKTTQNYGDVESTFISFPVHDIWNTQVDLTRSQEISACFIPEYNSYLITYPRRGSENFDLIGYNVATGDIFHWEGFNASFLISFHDDDSRTRLLAGTTDANIGIGNLSSTGQFTDFLASFSSGFTTGNIFPTYQPKSVWQFKRLTVFYRPQGTSPINITYFIDNTEEGTIQVLQQGAGSVALGSFILGTDILGGTSGEYTQTTKEITGYGNSIQLEFDCTPDADESSGMEIYGYEIECEQMGDSTIPLAIS